MWVLKIHTYIGLSTLHSEYVELYRSVRELLPLKNIIKEVIDILRIDSKKLNYVSSFTVYEDNNGAIVLATSPRTTPTSNHVAVKYHWFR